MDLASSGASTPFITRTPSNAVTFASVAGRFRLGLAGAGEASALLALPADVFDGFASLFSANTEATETAANRMVDRDFFHVNIGDISSRARFFPSALWSNRLLRRNMVRNPTSTRQTMSSPKEPLIPLLVDRKSTRLNSS